MTTQLGGLEPASLSLCPAAARVGRTALAGLPVARLIVAPTPCYQLSELGRAWGHPELFVKREDLTAPGYGGNKVRNLEYLLGDALAVGARRLVTVGPLGSNFIAALGYHAANVGVPVEVHHFTPLVNGQIRAHAQFTKSWDADLRLHGQRWPTYAAAAVAGLAVLRERQRSGAYYVSPGGSNVLGAVGHAGAALELAEQIGAGSLPLPELIVVGAGTCGTMAGLLAGLHLAGLPTRVVGVRCVDGLVCNRRRIARLATAVLRRLGNSGTIKPAAVDLRLPPGPATSYAEEHPHTASLISEVNALTGLLLDTTYTSKVVTFLEQLLRSGAYAGRPVLYWHTYNSWPLTRRSSLLDS